MSMNFAKDNWLPLVGGAVILLIVFGLIGTCRPEPEVNTELARTAREAVEMSRDAQRSNDAAYLWPGRLRMLAVALGVGIPIAAAVVIFWIVMRRRPDDVELTGLLDQRGTKILQANIENDPVNLLAGRAENNTPLPGSNERETPPDEQLTEAASQQQESENTDPADE